ncbi:MAG: hypothetical protein HAW67_01315 [Endozoicomonadaceae bacterium]|nr:hypothetical protein [Endozoicomonadaceae bacterium]MBE8232343.1 hypothetical protein [Endozoicomonadaceae bacterium]
MGCGNRRGVSYSLCKLKLQLSLPKDKKNRRKQSFLSKHIGQSKIKECSHMASFFKTVIGGSLTAVSIQSGVMVAVSGGVGAIVPAAASAIFSATGASAIGLGGIGAIAKLGFDYTINATCSPAIKQQYKTVFSLLSYMPSIGTNAIISDNIAISIGGTIGGAVCRHMNDAMMDKMYCKNNYLRLTSSVISSVVGGMIGAHIASYSIDSLFVQNVNNPMQMNQSSMQENEKMNKTIMPEQVKMSNTVRFKHPKITPQENHKISKIAFQKADHVKLLKGIDSFCPDSKYPYGSACYPVPIDSLPQNQVMQLLAYGMPVAKNQSLTAESSIQIAECNNISVTSIPNTEYRSINDVLLMVYTKEMESIGVSIETLNKGEYCNCGTMPKIYALNLPSTIPVDILQNMMLREHYAIHANSHSKIILNPDSIGSQIGCDIAVQDLSVNKCLYKTNNEYADIPFLYVHNRDELNEGIREACCQQLHAKSTRRLLEYFSFYNR